MTRVPHRRQGGPAVRRRPGLRRARSSVTGPRGWPATVGRRSRSARRRVSASTEPTVASGRPDRPSRPRIGTRCRHRWRSAGRAGRLRWRCRRVDEAGHPLDALIDDPSGSSDDSSHRSGPRWAKRVARRSLGHGRKGPHHRSGEAHRDPVVDLDDTATEVSRLPPPLAAAVEVPGPGHPHVGLERETTRESDQQVLADRLDRVDPLTRSRDGSRATCGASKRRRVAPTSTGASRSAARWMVSPSGTGQVCRRVDPLLQPLYLNPLLQHGPAVDGRLMPVT